MTSALSAISGQFSKSLILGTFFPMVIFIVLNMIFVAPFFPVTRPFLNPFQEQNAWQIIVTSFLTILLSGLLYNLNIPLIRLYEGYPWKDSWIGQWRVQCYQARFNYYSARWKGMLTLMYALEQKDPPDPRRPVIVNNRGKLGESLNSQFPGSSELVLPTRLGNVIRGFEYYALDQYGMDAVVLYPRLLSKIDKEYAAALADSKTSFDFMINSSFLFGVLAFSVLIVGLIYPTQLTPLEIGGLSVPLVWLLEVAVFMGLAYWFYCTSIASAHEWGDMVKGAFDLYRWSLLDQLGYKRPPKTKKAEDDLWQKISQRMLYGKPLTPPDPDYDPGATTAVGEPSTVALEISRGVVAQYSNGMAMVVLQVKNVDLRKRKAHNVVVTETIPEGFDYEWGSVSARLSHDGLISVIRTEVAGVNPYRFSVGDVPVNGTVYLQYRTISRKDEKRSFYVDLFPMTQLPINKH